VFIVENEENATADSVYHDLVAQAGLYGQAFFGWDSSREERRMLDNLWREAVSVTTRTREVNLWLHSTKLPLGW